MKGKLIDVVKIVFSDFDNTMLHYYSNKNYFDDYQLEILQKLQKEGIKFGIVTGRCVSFFSQFPKLLEVVDFILASNGACIYDVKNNTFIYNNIIHNNSLEHIIEYAKENHANFILNCMNNLYRYGNWLNISCDDYLENVFYSCEQIVLFVNKKKLDSFRKYLSKFKDICVNNVTFWNQDVSMDINNIGVSKGNSVVWLCQYLGVDLKDTIGFGDGENDLSMFEVVGKSIAVGNASDKIRQNTDDVCLKCENNGIYKYLEDNILK